MARRFKEEEIVKNLKKPWKSAMFGMLSVNTTCQSKAFTAGDRSMVA